MDWQKLTQFMDSLAEHGIPGSEIIVYQDHQELYHHCAGYSDAAQQLKTNGTELYWLYSASKVSTCTAMMQLIEQKKVRLDDPVSVYLPSFGTMMVKEGDILRPAKNPITIRMLMSMQSGLNYNLNSPSIQKAQEFYGSNATTRQMIDAIAQEPLDFEPGAHYQYSLSHDVLGAVIEVVSGTRYADYLQTNLFTPLGMRQTSMIPSPDLLHKLAARYRVEDGKTHNIENQTNCFHLSNQYDSGGAGLISCANDYILLADALACGGIGQNGAQILSQESIDLMRTPQVCGDGPIQGRTGYGYGLGVRVLVDTKNSSSPLGEFGWDGAAGAYLMSVPERKLSCFYVQHVLSCGYAFDVVHTHLRDLVCQITA